jgi:excisionase family DNA binding protein
MRGALDLLEEIILYPHRAAPLPHSTTVSDAHQDRRMSDDRRKIAYSIKEVRELTGIGHSKIYAEIQMGRLKVSKSGRRTLVLAKDLHEWVGSWAKSS